MKIKTILHSIGAPIVALMAISTASATFVFNENFDGSPYSNNTFVPTGLNQINYGQWGGAGTGWRAGVASVNNSLSESRSMALTRTASFNNGSRAIGSFGYDNQAISQISDPLNFRLAFNMTDQLTGFLIGVRGSDDRTRAFVELSEGNIQASFGGVRQVLSAVAPDTWYYVEFILPEAPVTSSIYTANLYAEDGATLLGSQSGVLAQSVNAGANNYTYFVASHTMLDETLYIDNITAQIIPEANALYGIISILVVGLIYRARQRFAGK